MKLDTTWGKVMILHWKVISLHAALGLKGYVMLVTHARMLIQLWTIVL